MHISDDPEVKAALDRDREMMEEHEKAVSDTEVERLKNEVKAKDKEIAELKSEFKSFLSHLESELVEIRDDLKVITAHAEFWRFAAIVSFIGFLIAIAVGVVL